MSDMENEIRDSIRQYLEEGYEITLIPDLLLYRKLIEIWSIQGKEICTLEDIKFVSGIVNSRLDNTFIPKKTVRDKKEAAKLISVVEADLKGRDESAMGASAAAIMELLEKKADDNILTLLTDLLSDHIAKLGKLLAFKILLETIVFIYSSDENQGNEDTEQIYKNVILMRYMEGYSTDDINDILRIKVILMEWLDSAMPITDAEDLLSLYREIADNSVEGASLTPRSKEDAEVLTEKFISDLKSKEYDGLTVGDFKSLSKEDAKVVVLECIREYKSRIGSKLMQETLTALLKEIETKTANYDEEKRK